MDYDELIEAADLLGNFSTYWNACDDVDKPDEARHQLVSKIVDRVFVYNNQILGVVLHGDFAVVLGENTTAPEGNSDAAEWDTISQSLAKFLRSQCGSDGGHSSYSHPMTFTCVYMRHYTVISGRDKLPVIFAPVGTLTATIRVGFRIVIIAVRC